VLMAELSTGPDERAGLQPGTTAVSAAMVLGLEEAIDGTLSGVELSPAFAVPGENRLSGALDLARTVVRRAERLVSGLDLGDSQAPAYLNRLSDLCWALARRHEDIHLVAGGRNASRRVGAAR